MLNADPTILPPSLADWATLLRPWCAHLERSASLSVVRVAAVAGTAAEDTSVLGVNVAIAPTDATLSRESVRLIRDAVELLAALAHVDNPVWRSMLQHYCGCSGMPDDDTFLPPRFTVGFGKNWYSATALDTRFFDQFFFGALRDRNRTDAYVQAMETIYAKMPVKLRRNFADRGHRGCRYFISLSFKPPVHMESAERVIAYFKSLRTLVKSISEVSVSHRHGGDREEELDQSASMPETFPFENCFMLEGVRLKITRIDVPPRGTALIAELMAQGVEFTPEIDVYQESAFRAITVANNGPMLMGIMDSARLSEFLGVPRFLPAKAYKLHEVHVDNSAISKETFYYDPDTRRFQALCSALAISQDVDELYLNNLFYNDDYAARPHKWRWLSYALFSNSAFSSPRITSLVLAEYSFRERDMAAIQSVLAARFPIQLLLDRAGICEFFDEDEYDSDENDERHSSMDIEGEQKTTHKVESLALGSGANSGETQCDDFIQSTDYHDDVEYDAQREQVRHASSPYAEMFTKSSQERSLFQPHYRSNVPGDAAVNNVVDGVDAAVDDDAGVVFLKEGAVVFVNPFDLEEKGKPPESLVLKHDSCFPIICNDERCRWIDILVPCFGHCAVPRVLVDQIVSTPTTGSIQNSLSRGYTGAIRSLELHFKIIDSVERSVLPLLQYLGSQLTTLTFSNKVTENLDEMRQLLEACPHIHTFVTETAPPKFETMLLAAYEVGACRIESLSIDSFSVDPQHTLAFILNLQDPRSALARKLRKLSLCTTRAAPFGAIELSAFLEVLRQNKTLVELQLTVPSSVWKEFQPQLMNFDGELIPVEKQPLPVRCRVAFLSVMRVSGTNWNERVASEGERTEEQERSHKRQRLAAASVDLTRLDRGVMLLIFQFAAERESRSIRVVEMAPQLDEETEYDEHVRNPGDFS